MSFGGNDFEPKKFADFQARAMLCAFLETWFLATLLFRVSA